MDRSALGRRAASSWKLGRGVSLPVDELEQPFTRERELLRDEVCGQGTGWRPSRDFSSVTACLSAPPCPSIEGRYRIRTSPRYRQKTRKIPGPSDTASATYAKYLAGIRSFSPASHFERTFLFLEISVAPLPACGGARHSDVAKWNHRGRNLRRLQGGALLLRAPALVSRLPEAVKNGRGGAGRADIGGEEGSVGEVSRASSLDGGAVRGAGSLRTPARVRRDRRSMEWQVTSTTTRLGCGYRGLCACTPRVPPSRGLVLVHHRRTLSIPSRY